MKKSQIIFLGLGIILILIPFILNIYSIFKLLILIVGIALFELSFVLSKKRNLIFLLCLPILLIIFTYGIDYIKTFTLNLKPIYVWENKINAKVSVYNSIFYRIFKCDNEYILDKNYKSNFACSPNLLENIDVNKFLNEPQISFKKYKNDFVKITGKISRINGTNSLELREYTNSNNSLNGHVNFNENNKLIGELEGINPLNYKVYDYITIVGLVDSIKDNTITLKNIKIVEGNLYNEYTIQVIEKDVCSDKLEEYTDNFYTKCIENIYLDYGIDKYELSYALKDGKITYDKLITDAKINTPNNYKLYSWEKFSLLNCNSQKNILLSSTEMIDYSLCEE